MYSLKRRKSESFVLRTPSGDAIINVNKIGINTVHFLMTLPESFKILRCDESGAIKNKRIDINSHKPSE